ncbi:MAG TPA: nucleotidyltransferase family protein, partial [Ktedonobacterales bacterium]|nr:nucleotidyltransferase family protein [Ktedonobacterales bacterium]
AAAVELHRDLLQLGPPTRCQPALWERAQPLLVGKMRARMLSLEHQLLHLAVHLHTHGFSRLIWFKDLDLLLRRHQGEVDWVALHALARAEGVSLSLRHALAAVRELLGTPLPPEAGRDLGWDPLGMVAHAVLWPRSRVLALAGKQRLRSVRFNPRQGPSGVVPSLVVMGRRREKLAHLWRASRAPAGEQPAATRRPAPAGEEVDHDAGESLSSFDPRSHQ